MSKYSEKIKRQSSLYYQSAFTIVEILVIIVIIGILATITLVSYTGVSEKAKIASMISDLDTAAKQMKMFYAEYGNFPTSLDGNSCPVGPADARYCLKTSSNSTFNYNSIIPKIFHLTITNGNLSYSITNDSVPTVATTPSTASVGSICPTGYIPVPGSGTYGTNDFCVGKYEAKNVGGVAVSQASLAPWVSISQATAITTATNACTGCHLITEAEWLTIAQNVLSVPSNWSSGIVGSGYIYSGHNDSAPLSTLAADPSDANGYSGETNVGGNQRRTLTLTNGEVIWDFAGNVLEWTTGSTTTGQPGISGTGVYAYHEWPTLTTTGALYPDPFPGTTGLSGSTIWNSTNGIGQITSKPEETVQHVFLRGGAYNSGVNAGVMTLNLTKTSTDIGSGLGFRVTR